MSDDPVIVELEVGAQVEVQERHSLDHYYPIGQIRFLVAGAARLILTGRLRELRALCREAVELSNKLEAYRDPHVERQSMRVVNFADGTMEITARVQAPFGRAPDFFVEGPEAVKRYRKWIVLVAAGMLAESAPGVIDTAMRYVASLGPDSDD